MMYVLHLLKHKPLRKLAIPAILAAALGIAVSLSPAAKQEVSGFIEFVVASATGAALPGSRSSAETMVSDNHVVYRVPESDSWVRWPMSRNGELSVVCVSRGHHDHEAPFVRRGEPYLLIHDSHSFTWIYVAKLSSWDDLWIQNYLKWGQAENGQAYDAGKYQFDEWWHGAPDRIVCWTESAAGDYRALVVNIKGGPGPLTCDEISKWFVKMKK